MIIKNNDYLNLDLKNKIIIFPTDTVYGIGCLYDDLESIRRIYDIKNRDYSKPMVILCANYEQINSLIKENQEIPNYIKNHWPGKLTVIFNKNETVNKLITSNKETVGIRIPGNQVSLELLNRYGPMVVTSLNLSNEPAIIKYKDALKFHDLVDYIIKGKDLTSVPSTVYDLTTGKTLRQGEISITK
ncbi:L-threonylcarbamoyladenylate synthase [Candidatus Izemoplasma sp. B36]|uniref:L-threonylcarbamoyladenylate synthase n=1 Tax=Candidatus Izemoplasma sp. B36 TaxID=3242468 RepID=UPI00355895D9